MVMQLLSLSPLPTTRVHAGGHLQAISHPPQVAILDVETQLTFQCGNTSITGNAAWLCPRRTWKRGVPLQ